MYEVLRILQELKEIDNLPKMPIMENVVDLVQAKFVKQWQGIQQEIEKLGYVNYQQTLNAKEYGIAQNRDRVFMVSLLGDYNYNFPNGFDLKHRLKDYLEEEVDEKYYLSDRALNGIKNTTFNSSTLCARDYKDPKLVVEPAVLTPKRTEYGKSIRKDYESGNIQESRHNMTELQPREDGISNTLTTVQKDNLVLESKRLGGIFDKDGKRHQAGSIWDKEQLSPTLDTMQGGHRQPFITEYFIPIPEATKKGYAEAKDGDGVYLDRPHQKRGVVQDGLIQTLKTSGNDVGVVVAGEMRTIKTNDNRFFSQALETLAENDVEYGDSISAYNKKVDRSGTSPTITTRPEGLKTAILPVTQNLRIRKLTPRETGRLMGMNDYHIDRQEKTTSNAQMYKQHGNGIVAQVIGLIIGMAYYDDEIELREKVMANSHMWIKEKGE